MLEFRVSMVIFLLFIFMINPAYAYIDPGSGSMLLQLLLGGVAGAAVVLKMYWRRFVSIFGVGRNKKNGSEPADSDE
jgi:hypothetical protein